MNETEKNYELYSFNEIMAAPFLKFGRKIFQRTDNNLILGIVSEKYNSRFKFESIIKKGIIKFITPDKKSIVICGDEILDLNEKIFKLIDT